MFPQLLRFVRVRAIRVCFPILVLTMAGCSAEQELTVSAAASLTNAFTELAQAYEKAYPGAHVTMNFGGSGSLLRQLEQGAPIDVFASADEETMDRAQQQRLVAAETRADFAANTLVLIAPADSALRIGKLDDLGVKEIERIAISNPDSVPVGRYARRALEEANVWESLAPKYINTQNVRQSLDYVARGEVDVGFVYATDAAVMPDKVRTLMHVPTAVRIAYPLAMVTGTRHRNEAMRFIRFVRSTTGQDILQRYGFTGP